MSLNDDGEKASANGLLTSRGNITARRLSFAHASRIIPMSEPSWKLKDPEQFRRKSMYLFDVPEYTRDIAEFTLRGGKFDRSDSHRSDDITQDTFGSEGKRSRKASRMDDDHPPPHSNQISVGQPNAEASSNCSSENGDTLVDLRGGGDSLSNLEGDEETGDVSELDNAAGDSGPLTPDTTRSVKDLQDKLGGEEFLISRLKNKHPNRSPWLKSPSNKYDATSAEARNRLSGIAMLPTDTQNGEPYRLPRNSQPAKLVI